MYGRFIQEILFENGKTTITTANVVVFNETVICLPKGRIFFYFSYGFFHETKASICYIISKNLIKVTVQMRKVL